MPLIDRKLGIMHSKRRVMGDPVVAIKQSRIIELSLGRALAGRQLGAFKSRGGLVVAWLAK
jgi:hypothetical protein